MRKIIDHYWIAKTIDLGPDALADLVEPYSTIVVASDHNREVINGLDTELAEHIVDLHNQYVDGRLVNAEI
jgi:hypothetical protein